MMPDAPGGSKGRILLVVGIRAEPEQFSVYPYSSEAGGPSRCPIVVSHAVQTSVSHEKASRCESSNFEGFGNPSGGFWLQHFRVMV